jgi:DTW domain-containing protein YfiP
VLALLTAAGTDFDFALAWNSLLGHSSVIPQVCISAVRVAVNRNLIAYNRCYECFRPRSACFCAAIPSIDNRTEVLILQHRRERFHPFNTARIVHKALRNSQLLADHTSKLVGRFQLKRRAGLLYPGPGARLVTDIPPELRPEQLVLLDGTWHQAKTLLRDIPELGSLPHYQLAPAFPSRYRIRREPNASALSTVEATVAALRVLEPETEGLDELLKAFNTMVEGQLAHPKSASGQRLLKRGNRTFKNIPLALIGDLSNVVVAYGESACGARGRKQAGMPPVYWVAKRLGTGETFSCLIHPPRQLNDIFLEHLELTRDDFGAAVSLDEARRQWAKFRRANDAMTMFHSGSARLFSLLDEVRNPCLVLKSIDLEPNLTEPELERFLIQQRVLAEPIVHAGRAGKRLATAVAFVRYLNALGNAGLQNRQPSAVEV